VEKDEYQNLPFTSISHAEALRTATAEFGWERRSPTPRSMTDGRLLIGWGVASAFYPTNISPAKVIARLTRDGVVDVLTAASDMGPGTWTSLTQVAASVLDVPVSRVNLAIGYSDLPQAPVHGGSHDHGQRRQCGA
jgi:xanthine dehydrogenase YagR molybdenum-binding subunit